MRVRPGVNLVRGVAVVALASLLAFFWWPIVLPLAGLLVLLGLSTEYERRELRRTFERIAVRRQLPAVIGRDCPLEVGLTVTNGNAFAVRGELRDEHPEAALPRLVSYALEIPAGSSSSVATTCRIPRRGRHHFGPVWIRLEGNFRLLEAQRAIDCAGSVKVLPETFASRDQLQKDIGAELRLLDQQRRARGHGTGTEFESLYPFRQGDDPRRIDWRATARQRTLVVRRFQVERHRDVMIILDAGRLMGTHVGPSVARSLRERDHLAERDDYTPSSPGGESRGTKLDCAVDAALNLSRVALQSGDRCGVAAFDRGVRGFLPPVAGTSALRSIVECVYDLDTQWHESDFTPMLAELRARQAKRTFLIVISDLSDAETSKRLCASLQQLQRQHLVLFAALKTPLLGQIVREEISSLEDGARKAVAFRLLRDRGRALHSLRHGGVHILDVEPQQLTLPLINQFVELRQRNLL